MDQREEKIRRRAHEMWEQEGRQDGHAAEHWERATSEIDGGETVAPVEAGDGEPQSSVARDDGTGSSRVTSDGGSTATRASDGANEKQRRRR